MTNILEIANGLLTGDRAATHGEAGGTFAAIADLWSAYLTHILGSHVRLTRDQAATMMALFKIARMHRGRFNPDDYVDAAAYVKIAHDCRAAALEALRKAE